MKPQKRKRNPTKKTATNPEPLQKSKKRQSKAPNASQTRSDSIQEETVPNQTSSPSISGQGYHREEETVPSQPAPPRAGPSGAVDQGYISNPAPNHVPQAVNQRYPTHSPAPGTSGLAPQQNGMFTLNHDTHIIPESNKTGGQVQNCNINTCHTPTPITSIFDPISSHVPLKIKEKAWSGAYIDLNLLLKSSKELADFENFDGDLSIRGGMLSVTKKPSHPIKSIQVWTSAYMIYASIMLERWENKGLEFFKYMDTVRVAASRGFNLGWVQYDEQYRLRKERNPSSSWGVVDNELWMIYVCTPNGNVPQNTGYQATRYMNANSYYTPQPGITRPSQPNDRQAKNVTCKYFNRGQKCDYGKSCKFAHKCSKCNGFHAYVNCRLK